MTRGDILATRARIAARLDCMADQLGTTAPATPVIKAGSAWWECITYGMTHTGQKHSAERLSRLEKAREATQRASTVARNDGDTMLAAELAAIHGMME